MPPKKGKKKKDDGSEPMHDPSWERAVETGVWERSAMDLPDANTWPTWGALRERVLTACKEIKIVNTASLRDAFCNEIVKLSPLELWHMDFHGSSNLRNFVLSPSTACSKLTELDLSDCGSLNYVLIQSDSLTTIKLHKCAKLNKALLHCPHLSTLTISDNPMLETLMIWSDDLTHLDLSGCNNIINLKLHCPNLVDQRIPPLKVIEKHIKPTHPPIASILKANYSELAHLAADAKEKERKGLKDDSIIPRAHRPF
ncbi:flagellar associated protein [Dunaliella salina]|uniref:Flagellar associated protein n=1 Tax=Dunaliella salina TaxID=3046 RepID=A0ABQ7GSI2_DUNSA|nr:flagellar associated protein [Dunaliella salina]|eukprot:KAF5837579.1 flagellar associated protein [Dunaliella salina]